MLNGGNGTARERSLTRSTSIVGFDSAWTDKPKAPGAICSIRIDGKGGRSFVEPRLASFAQAIDFIDAEGAMTDRCLIALDQPTIVPNLASLRPVDRVAASLISWLGGGVQPANRSKIGMFDDAAPLWPFLALLSATEDPERARIASSGRYLIEVFPALAVASIETAFFGRLLGPRYNPARRKTFRLADWHVLLSALARYADLHEIDGVGSWISQHGMIEKPGKADQDRLDALLCAVIGFHWLMMPRDQSIMIGDLETGYMIAPATPAVRGRLEDAASRYAVPVDNA